MKKIVGLIIITLALLVASGCASCNMRTSLKPGEGVYKHSFKLSKDKNIAFRLARFWFADNLPRNYHTIGYADEYLATILYRLKMSVWVLTAPTFFYYKIKVTFTDEDINITFYDLEMGECAGCYPPESKMPQIEENFKNIAEEINKAVNTP